MFRVAFGLLVLISFNVEAQVVGQITKVASDKSRVLIKSNRNLKLGDGLMVSRGCSLKVTKASSGRAVAALDECERTSQLAIGRKVSAVDSSSMEFSSEIQDTSISKKWRGSLTMPFGSQSFDFAGQNFDATVSGFLLGIGYQDRIEGPLGYLAEFKIGSVTYRANNVDQKSAPFAIMGNVTYFLNDYVTFAGGLNLTNGNYSVLTGPGVSVDQTPQIAIQLGANFSLTKEIGASVMYVQQKTKLQARTSSGTMTGVSSYDIESSGLQLGVFFNF
jgi:hypothetical protein